MRALLQHLSATIKDDAAFSEAVKQVAADYGIPLYFGNVQEPKAQQFFATMRELWEQRHPLREVGE